MRKILILIIFVTISGCGFFKGEWKIRDALDIANRKVVELRYDINKFNVVYDENNSYWNKYAKDVHLFELNPSLKEVFQKRKFWVFIYVPKNQLNVDGGIDIFIDRKNKKIFMINEGTRSTFY